MRNGMWRSALVASGLILALSACGGDDEGQTPGGNAGGTGGSGATGGAGGTGGGSDGGTGGGTAGTGGSSTGGTGGGGSTGCPNHPNVTTGANGECRISAAISAPMTQDITLDAGNVWYLDGPLVVGDDSAKTVLTIQAGTTVFGGDGSFILIQRGSQIMAEGTKDAPIVLTSAKAVGSRGPEDWGGLVINGRAPINNAANADGSAPGEAGTGKYGGNVPDDNSGVLKYVRVEFAGNKIDLENELNGIAFQGVGSGTTVDFIQTHMTSDDGVEFFGGTVNVKHVVVTGSDDDSVDWTGGWTGKAQFVVAKQSADSGTEAERGIEADNLKGTNSATPYSNPTLANVTLIARSGNAKQGMILREGTKGHIHNVIVTGWDGYCVTVDHDQTKANVDDGSLVVANGVFHCGAGAAEAGSKAADLLAKDAKNKTADPMLGGANGWMPGAGSPAIGIGAGPTDAFFTQADYAGAFDGTTDWTEGWIETATK